MNTVIKTLFDDLSEKELHETLDMFGVNILISIIRMILLTVTNLSGVSKILVIIIVIYGIINNL